MKKSFLLLSVFAVISLIYSCSNGDDVTPKDGDGGSSNVQAEIYTVLRNGIYERGVPLDEDNYLTVHLYVEQAGPYEITTSEQNGYKFTASGEFEAVGSAEIKLLGAGTPVNDQTDSVQIVTKLDQHKIGIQIASNLSNKIIIANGGDDFDGVWSTVAITGRGELLWQIPGHSNHVAISNETAYFSDSHALKAVDIATGEEIWANEALKEMYELTLSGQVLYIANGSSDFWAVDATSGEVLWAYDPVSPYIPYGAPVVGTDMVFFTEGNTIHAVNKSTGTLVWKGTTFSCTGTPVLHEGILYMSGGFNGGTVAVNASTGTVVWKNDVSTSESPVLAEGRLYVNSTDMVHCFNAGTGETIWSTPIEDLAKSPVVYDEKVYVTTDFGFTSVYALSADTGTEVWSKGSSMGFCESDLVAHQGMLYVGNSSSLDGFHAGSGNLVTYFGATGGELMMEYNSIMAIYDTESKETAYPTYSAQ